MIIRYAARSSRMRRRKAAGWLARDGLDHPVEVEAGEVQPQRQLVARGVVVVEHLGEGVDEAHERVPTMPCKVTNADADVMRSAWCLWEPVV